MTLIFTGIQRVKIRLLSKSNGVGFMYRWFMYVTWEHWMVPQQGHFIFVIFAVGSTVRRPSLGKFVRGLDDILFMTYHTSSCINTIVCSCPVLVQRGGFSFGHYMRNTWCHWYFAFAIVTTKSIVAESIRHTLDMLPRLAESKVLVVYIGPIAVLFLQVIIAFAFTFFSLC